MNNEHHETIPRPMSSYEVKAYSYKMNLKFAIKNFITALFMSSERLWQPSHNQVAFTYITNLHMFVFLLVTDGLIDCQDPECCEAAVCKSSQLCATVARPVDILLQRQPPASTASFFQKMRFIIEEGSLQRYAKNTAFNER